MSDYEQRTESVLYIKREKSATNACGIYPVIGKIIVGGTLAQFSSKLKVDERLWDVKSGRATGKSRQAVELNRAINRINLAIHASYKDILKRTGKVTAVEVKNAFQVSQPHRRLSLPCLRK